ncbi:hypothetical protein [Mycobacterium stomatepiae]|nr:hypothetical protein [Mycobacterium stomatepiae]MCV7165119.1 hypothetical protein [Mycobacterium stomatepiae]
MTSDTAHTGAPGRRFSTAALVVAGLVGLIVGAIAAFAVTGLVFTVRLQLPPPPYPPPFSSTPAPVYPAPPVSVAPAPSAGIAPAPAPSVVPAPPLPPSP